jgi:hypothetical protein
VKRGAQRALYTDQQQRMAAEIEEIIMKSDLLPVQRLLPDLGDRLL